MNEPQISTEAHPPDAAPDERQISTSAGVVVKVKRKRTKEEHPVVAQVSTIEPLLIRTSEVPRLICSLSLLRIFEAAEWIEPFYEGNRLSCWSIAKLRECVRRRDTGEIPKLLRPVRRD